MKKPRSNNHPILIIGSGLSAYTLVRELRKLNPTVPITLITRNDAVYYSKPQLSNALSHQKTAEQLQLFSKEKCETQWQLTIHAHTEVELIDHQRHCCLTNKGEFYYSQLIIATGARPIQLPGLSHAVSVNNLNDYKQFRAKIIDKKSILIVGTGLVGCEFANDLLNAGYEISLASLDRYPLQKLIPEMAGLCVKNAFAAKGVNWLLEKTIDQIDLVSDVVLSAVGLVPDITLAQKSGIQTNRGIVVNEYLQTNINDIYALGDCIELKGLVLPYIAPLSLGARALAKTLLDAPTEVRYPPMPIFVKTPLCPVVALPVLTTHEVNWQIEQLDDYSVKALCYDGEKQLRGFALTGKATALTQELVKQISVLF